MSDEYINEMLLERKQQEEARKNANAKLLTDKTIKSLTLGSKVIVSDPCYKRKTWCAVYNIKAKPGKYNTKVNYSDEGTWGVRISELIAIHDDYKLDRKTGWKLYEGRDCAVGVDSGQAGIFCDSVYPKGETGDCGKEGFYGDACRCTLDNSYPEDFSQLPWNIMPNGKGVVSQTGYGDGAYSLFVIRNTEDIIVGFKIKFI